MRTTLNIEEAAITEIKKYAEAREISLGQAASDLIHRGAESLPDFQLKNGWVIFESPAGAAPMSNENIDKWESEAYEEEYRRAFSPRR